jgi:hypothetical protein
MMKKISKSETLLARLSKEQTPEMLTKEQLMTAAESFNTFLEKVKTDFQLKDKKSQISASQVQLTA